MMSFLLAPFGRRLRIISALSLLLVLAWYGSLIVLSIDGWNAAHENVRVWQSGKKQKCEELAVIRLVGTAAEQSMGSWQLVLFRPLWVSCKNAKRIHAVGCTTPHCS
jgi:hypothetical protein